MIQYTAPILLLALSASTALDSTTVDSTSVEDAARELRIQIYDNYRLDRDEYNRRREIAAEVLRRLEKADEQQQQEIFNWIEQSTHATQNSDALPLLPGGEFRPEEQLAEDATSVTTDSMVDTNPRASDDPAVQSVSVDESVPLNESVSGDEVSYSQQSGDESQPTSIVRSDKFGLQPESRTFSILGSVGRAVTSAVAGGVGRGSTPDEAISEDANRLDDAATVEVPPVEAEIATEPIAEETTEESFDDFSDDDLNLDELILESPASDGPLAPTPETFQRES